MNRSMQASKRCTMTWAKSCWIIALRGSILAFSLVSSYGALDLVLLVAS